jgi:uncharacterized membrane protein YesL
MRLLARLPYDTIFTTVYAGLKINLCLLATCAPLLVVFALSRDPLAAWPFFAALSALCGPAVAAAFTAFQAFSDGEDTVGRAYWTSYRKGFWRSLAIAGSAAALVIVLGVDLQLAVGTRFGAVTPMLVLLIALVVSVTTAVLAAGGLRSLRLLPAFAYLCVRKWYLSLANLAVLGVLAAAVVGKPAVGLFLLPAPALYVVWANARHIISNTNL